MSASTQRAPTNFQVAEKKQTIKGTPAVNWRTLGIYVALALGFFLLGAVPMGFRAHENANQRDAAQHELRLSQMQNTLSSAVIDARRGDYEPARQLTSDFFNDLRKQLDVTGDRALFAPEQRQNLKPLLSQRDDVITLLARSDPASAERLSNLYVAYRKATSGVWPGQDSARTESRSL